MNWNNIVVFNFMNPKNRGGGKFPSKLKIYLFEQTMHFGQFENSTHS